MPEFNSFFPFPLWLLIMIAWVLPWKGYALWKAARRGSRNWFIALLVVNTLAILEILYIFVFSKKSKEKPLYNEAFEESKSENQAVRGQHHGAGHH